MERLEARGALEQGIILAALLDGHEDAAAPLGRIAGQDCAEQYAELQRATAAGRRHLVAQLSRRLFSPVPAGLDRIHPGWIRHLLEAQRPEVARVVLAALPATVVARAGLELDGTWDPSGVPPWVRAQLLRRVLGSLEPMPVRSAVEEPAPDRLVDLPLAALEGLLTRLGVVLLAWLTRRAGDPTLIDSAEQRVPPELGSLFRRAVDADRPLPRELAALTLPGAGEMRRRLQSLALAAVGASLAPSLRRQLAQRLPRELGLPLWTRRGPPATGPSTLADALRLAREEGD